MFVGNDGPSTIRLVKREDRLQLESPTFCCHRSQCSIDTAHVTRIHVYHWQKMTIFPLCEYSDRQPASFPTTQARANGRAVRPPTVGLASRLGHFIGFVWSFL